MDIINLDDRIDFAVVKIKNNTTLQNKEAILTKIYNEVEPIENIYADKVISMFNELKIYGIEDIKEYIKHRAQQRKINQEKTKDLAIKNYKAKIELINNDYENENITGDNLLLEFDKTHIELKSLYEKNRIPEPITVKEVKERDKEGTKLDLLNGLEIPSGALTYIGARPGVGKTLTLINIARELLTRDKTVDFYTYEEHPKKILYKLCLSLYCESDKIKIDNWGNYKTPLKSFIGHGKEGSLPPEFIKEQWSRIIKWIESGKLNVFFCPGNSEILCNTIYNYHSPYILIDYIQKIPHPRPTNTRQVQIQEISGGLVELVSNTGQTCIIGAQLVRKKDKNNDENKSNISLSDFRESGDIEQDANIAIGIHAQTTKEYGYIEKDFKKADGRQLKYEVLKDRDSGNLIKIDMIQNANYWHLKKNNIASPDAEGSGGGETGKDQNLLYQIRN